MANRGNTSDEHEAAIDFICKVFQCNKTKIKGNNSIRGKYFPDATTYNSDFEVETAPKDCVIYKKEIKWDPTRKKILILTPTDYTKDLFDEIYYVIDNSIIKLK